MSNPSPPLLLQDQLVHLDQRFEKFEQRLGKLETHLGLAPVPVAEPPLVNRVPDVTAPVSPWDIGTTIPEATGKTIRVMPPPTAIAEPPTFAPPPRTTGAPSQAPSQFPPVVAAPIPTPPTPKPKPSLDWEGLIGGKWALWAGTFSLFLAVASFLAYTSQYVPPPPPWAKVLMGLSLGLAFILAGGLLRARTKRWFTDGLTGAGLAICYLSLWAAAQVFGILPFEAAFGAMALLTAVGVSLAVRYNAQSLSLLSTLGGFFTPLLLQQSGATGNGLPLLTYVLLLCGGIVAVSIFKRWRALVWLSFMTTLLLVLGWTLNTDISDLRWTIFAFLSAYFACYLAATTFYSLVHRETTADADLTLLFAVTSAFGLAGYLVIEPRLGWFPAAFPLGMALLLGLLTMATWATVPQNRSLRYSLGGLALLALTLSLPIQLQFQWLGVGWTTQAAILLVLAGALRSPLLLRGGQTIWLLSIFPLLTTLTQAVPAGALPLFNDRSFSLAVHVLLAAGLTAYYHRLGHLKSADQTSGHTARAQGWGDELDWLYAAQAVFGGGWLIAQETQQALAGAGTLAQGGGTSALLCVVASLWAVYSTALFCLGTKTGVQTVRMYALILVALAACLPLWTGLAEPTTQWVPFFNWRTLAFASAALALAAISWMASLPKPEITENEKQALAVGPLVTSLFVGLAVSLELVLGGNRAPSPSTELAICFYLAMFWGIYAMANLVLGLGWQNSGLRGWAYLLGVSSLCLLAVTALGEPIYGNNPLNLRSGAFVMLATLLGLAAWHLGRKGQGTRPWEATLPGLLNLLCAGTVLWGLSQELYQTFYYFRSSWGQHWQVAAGYGVVALWAVSTQGLVLGGLHRHQTSWRQCGYALGTAALGLMVIVLVASSGLNWTPVFNLRWLAFVGLTTMCLCVGLALSRAAARGEAITDEERGLVPTLFLVAALTLGVALTREVAAACYFYRADLGKNWGLWSQMTISVVWSLYGATLLGLGIAQRFKPLRLAALGLLSLTMGKVFLFDVPLLEDNLSMLSLAGLGLSLIFISWLYSRFVAEPNRSQNDKNDATGP